MQVVSSPGFTGTHAWDSLLLGSFDAATVRLHWTDQPYRWHENTGPEVFAVLDGEVEMRHLVDGAEVVELLRAGDVASMSIGDRHVAAPRGIARVLVVEVPGSE